MKNNILVVDDSHDSCSIIMRMLKKAGYEDVRSAESGELALAAVAAEKPDLILLDIRMTGIDGLEVCRRLKQDDNTRDVPVIFISGASDTEERVQGLSAGAVDYMIKPFDSEELLARVRTHLELRRITEIQTFLAQTSMGTAKEPFFNAMARYLANSLSMSFVCIDRLEGDGLTARTVAVWCDGKFEENVTYALKDTPCGDVVGNTVCCFPANVCQFFPRDQVLQDLRAESYVGATLWSHAGRPIGLIAVIGRTPLANRSMAETTLKMVAMRAAGELERLEAEEALQKSEKRYAMTLSAVNDGFWDWHVPSGNAFFSTLYYAILGYQDGEFPATYNSWRLLVHPDDIGRVECDIRKSIETGRGFAIDLRMKGKDGDWRWVSTRGKAIELDVEGKALRMVGTLSDITERKKIENEREALIVQLHEALDEVKKLSGILPICMHCKKIRNDKGYWNQLETYMSEHSEVKFSHGICSDCAKKHYPEIKHIDAKPREY